MNEQKDSLMRDHPDAFLLAEDDRDGLSAYLARLGWLLGNETILKLSKAGEGNMNCSLRVKTSSRSFIVKQGRPWVEKYPAIAAPWGRTTVEASFYQQISVDTQVAQYMPRLIGHDPHSQILALEDLGESKDFTDVYANSRIPDENIDTLADYLARLHALPIDQTLRPRFANRNMRRLNHEHIFCFPLSAENGLNLEGLTPGLTELAQSLKNDAAYARRVSELGEIYLADGTILLHGDYYPGSWLKTGMGLRVIDPEFSFLGPAEFDLGVMTAHLILSNHNDSHFERLFRRYVLSRDFNRDLTLQFAGVELMRRLIGVAQLPIKRDIAWKKQILARSRRFILRQGLA